jgi:mRNA interferase MazF
MGSKIRPAIVVLDSGDQDFVAVPVTSRQRVAIFDMALSDWQAEGLNTPSYVRVHKIAVLSKAALRSTIGTLTAGDLVVLCSALCRAYCPSQK